jgi:hypothetical protein
MEYLIGFVGGFVFALLAALVVWRKFAEIYVPPLDSLLTFALFDGEGNQLTDRAMISIGGDGVNVRPVVANVIRTGAIHHGVIYLGEYGSVIETSGDPFVQIGDTYVVPVGEWSTELT